jgi:hypothetical protein
MALYVALDMEMWENALGTICHLARWRRQRFDVLLRP